MLPRWLELVLVTACVLGTAEGARRFRRAADGEITIEEILHGAAEESDLTLKFVNAVWRHGDRSPTGRFKGSALNEDAWEFGGGGFGQLTPTGMKQHFELGTKLRDRYINSTFLSSRYNSREIYVRASDVNRTIISAMSNTLGMYSQKANENRVNTDYPDIPGWPAGFVPIAVHTVDKDTDYVAYESFPCQRLQGLYKLYEDSEVFKAYVNQRQVRQTLDLLTRTINQTIDMWNIGDIADGIFIEKLYYPKNITTWYPWYAVNARVITAMDQKANEFINGLVSAPFADIDIGKEVKKIMGGSLINNIRDHIKHKITCLEEPENCTSAFFRDLKYYAISSHDTTVAAFLSVLDASELVLPGGIYPEYAATVITELHQDTNGSYFLRFLYHANAEGDFDVITQLIAGPETGDFAPLSILDEQADKYAPGNVAELCNILPGTKPTTPEPIVPTTPVQPTQPEATNPTTTDAAAGSFFGPILIVLLALPTVF